MSSAGNRKYHIVVWGATGFTGSLCCDYIAARYTALKKPLKWAIAGRTETKLIELRSAICLKNKISESAVDVIVADIRNASSLDAMAAQTKVILSTAGPFARIGEPIVDACVRNGCNYVDITGEPQFVRKVIDKHHAAATAKNLKIVPCCGFDCIPVDLGCSVMVKEMKMRDLVPKEVKTTLTKMQGGASGGTISSIATAVASSTLRDLRELMNPYYLLPRSSTGQPMEPSSKATSSAAADKMWFRYDPVIGQYCAPFFMQSIDTRVVNRSNAIGGADSENWKYGQDFIYSEDMASPNFIVALLTTLISHIGMLLMYGNLTRALLLAFLPKPGEGPSKKDREEGFFFFRSHGKGLDPKTGIVHSIVGRFNGPNGDGGYKQTSAMVAEAAICLATDNPSPDVHGVLTPSTAFGQILIDRLKVSPGITFEIDK